MSNYKTWIKTTLLLCTALLVGIILGILTEKAVLQSQRQRIAQGDKLSWALSLIDERYVDDISRDSLAELVLPSILQELDPHTTYIPASEFAATNEPLTGSFDGIGVMFNMLTDTVQVTNVISAGPSAKAGVVAGDRIIMVDDVMIAGVKMDQDSVVKRLRGKRGSKVKLSIERRPAKELLPLTVTRDVIPMKSLEASFMARPGIGYIRFGRFASTTYQEVLAALRSLRDQGATKVIMDLRENTGGYLDQAIYIANEFLPKGNKIVYTEGNTSPRVDQNADGRGTFTDVELAIIIDEGSASASEIVAGAIQDNDRGTIIGRRSFGKGLVQEQFPYSDGSAIRMTVARYYTPLGRSIQKPYAPGKEKEYQQEIRWRYEHNEMLSADSIHLADSLRFFTPGGKVLYGGGGIMPDIFVPMDTSSVTPYFRELFQKNLIFKYATQITDQNRAQINDIKTFEQMNAFFARRNLFYDFVAYADRAGVRPAGNDLELSRDLITAQLKGYISRNTPLEEGAFYYYMMPQDKTLLRSIEALQQASTPEEAVGKAKPKISK